MRPAEPAVCPPRSRPLRPGRKGRAAAVGAVWEALLRPRSDYPLLWEIKCSADVCSEVLSSTACAGCTGPGNERAWGLRPMEVQLTGVRRIAAALRASTGLRMWEKCQLVLQQQAGGQAVSLPRRQSCALPAFHSNRSPTHPVVQHAAAALVGTAACLHTAEQKASMMYMVFLLDCPYVASHGNNVMTCCFYC